MKPRLAVLPLAVTSLALAIAGCGGNGSSSSSDTNASSTPSTTQSTPSTTSTTPSGGAAAGGGGASSSGGGSTLKLSADPSGQLKFNTSSLSGKAGNVTLVMDNPSSVPHAIAVEGNGVDKAGNTVQQGGTSKVSAKLKPGTYTFYCPVDGHKQAGMQGTLTVK